MIPIPGSPKRRVLGNVVVLLVFLAAIPVVARADGCFVWRKGADINEPAQKALVYGDGQNETIVLQVRYGGPAEDFAWIVPVPSRPRVDALREEDDPFPELSWYTQRRQRWGVGARSAEHPGDVVVLERKIAGVYDMAVLEAADPRALATWLDAEGFAMPKGAARVLGPYVAGAWFFVAMRIDPAQLDRDEIGALARGELQPIRVRFRSARLVYPLFISSLNAGRLDLLLWVLAPVPVVPEGWASALPGFEAGENVPGMAFFDERWGTFARLGTQDLLRTKRVVGVSPAARLHLSRFRTTIDAAAIRGDIGFTTFPAVPYWRGAWRRTTRAHERERAARHLAAWGVEPPRE